MEDAIRARRERLRKGVYGHVPTAEEHVQALLQEQQGEGTVMESITNQLLAEASSTPLFSQHLLNGNVEVLEKSADGNEEEEEDLYYKKIDWDLKREWNRQHKSLTKETQKAYKVLLKQRLQEQLNKDNDNANKNVF